MTPRFLSAVLLAALAAGAHAKLPAPDDAAKAKAAEAAAKTAWQGKVDNFQLCKAQDKVAAKVRKGPAPATPPCADPGPFVYTPPDAAPAAAAPAAPAPAAAAAPAKKS